MPSQIQVKQIDDCCGAILLHKFFKNPNPYDIKNFSQWERSYYGYTEESLKRRNIEEKVETHEQYLVRIRTRLSKIINDYKNKKSYLLAWLNSDENSQIGDILLDLGFEVAIPMTSNPTGTSIILYVYHLLPKETTVKKSSLPRRRTA